MSDNESIFHSANAETQEALDTPSSCKFSGRAVDSPTQRSGVGDGVGVEEGEGVGVCEGTGVKVDAGVKEGDGIIVSVIVAERCKPEEMHALDARRINSIIASLVMNVL